MEFTLIDHAERSARIVLAHDHVDIFGPRHAGAKNPEKPVMTYESADLLEHFEDLDGTPYDYITLATYGDTAVNIASATVSSGFASLDMAHFYVEGLFETGAGFCLPLSMVRAMLGDEANPDEKLPKVFVLSARKNFVCITVDNDLVRLSVTGRDNAGKRNEHTFNYSTPALLADIEKMVTTPSEHITFDLDHGSKLSIQSRETEKHTIAISFSACDQGGSELYIPLSLVRSLLVSDLDETQGGLCQT